MPAVAGLVFMATLLVGCGHAATYGTSSPSGTQRASVASASRSSTSSGSSPAGTSASTAPSIAPVAVQTANIQLLGLAQRRQEFLQIDPLSVGTGAVRDLWAVSRPRYCHTSSGTCGSVLWATTDSGTAWTVEWSSAKWDIQSVDFISSQAGWAVVQPAGCPVTASCPGQLWHTADSGAQWTTVEYGGTDVAGFRALNARDAWVVSLVGAQSDGICSIGPCTVQVFGSTDGGQRWTEEYHAAYEPDTAPVGPLTARVGKDGEIEAWMLVKGTVLALQNGGPTWKAVGSIPPGVEPLGGNMQFLNSQEGWLTFCNSGQVGDLGCMNYTYGTADGGHTWTLLRQGGCIQRSAIHMQTPRDGLLVLLGDTACQIRRPEENTVWATSDGGTAWHEVASVPYNLSAAAFSPGQLWVAGSLGLQCLCSAVIAQSPTAAWKWTLRTPVRDVPSFPYETLTDGHVVALAAGPAGQVTVLTSARGATWKAVGTVPQAGIDYLDSLEGTPNGPFLWLTVVCNVSPHEVCALVSSDSGATWTRRPLTSCTGEPWCARTLPSFIGRAPVSAPYSATAGAVSRGGTQVVAAMGRTDGALFFHSAGRGWREITLSGIRPYHIAFTASGFGLIGTSGGRFFVSTDGGTDWTQIP